MEAFTKIIVLPIVLLAALGSCVYMVVATDDDGKPSTVQAKREQKEIAAVQEKMPPGCIYMRVNARGTPTLHLVVCEGRRSTMSQYDTGSKHSYSVPAIVIDDRITGPGRKEPIP